LSRRFVLVLGALVVLLAGCKVDTTVDVVVRENGSGVVRVVVRADAEAVKAAESGGVPIDRAVRLADLAGAGYRIGEWHKAKDGSATVVISRRFDNVSEVEGIVRALNGPDGPLPRLRATRDRGIVATHYGVSGRIDLDEVTTGVSDDRELRSRLAALGVDIDKIDAQLLAQIRSSFSLEVVVRLPGHDPIRVRPAPGARTAAVDASAQLFDTERIALLAAAAGFLLLAIVVWFCGGRRRRRRRSRSSGRGAPSPGRGGAPSPRVANAAPRPAPPRPAPRPRRPRPPG
jgi:hypothetical protein